MTIQALETRELSKTQLSGLAELFALVWSSDEKFTDEDWNHAMGGTHFILEERDKIVAHAAVVTRQLETGGRELTTGYIEAVATQPRQQRKGYGSAVLRAASDFIRARFELGALDTGKPDFYRRQGWQLWQGPTGVRIANGIERTPEEDGQVMVLLTPRMPAIDFSAPISCDWRPGDVW